jgi:cephalosporin hydroxylase
MKHPLEIFREERKENVEKLGKSEKLKKLALEFISETAKFKYSYNFDWLGRPFIQLPQDIVAMQEIIWNVKPRLIVETGVAHGGGVIFYGSMLELIGNDGLVVGIDIQIRPWNKEKIEEHPIYKKGRIKLIEGSSTDQKVVDEVYKLARERTPVLVCLDSLHTHEHVLKELELYSPLVSKGSYIVVFDTIIEDMPDELFKDRPWGKGNNPKTAVMEFLKKNDRFVPDKEIENKLLITTNPDGYLKCIKD